MNIIEKITESIFFKDLVAKINSLIDNSNEVGGKVEFLEEIDTSKFEYLDDIENKASKTELSSAISTHNTNDAAHNDIRLLIQGLSTRLNALADSDDITLDQMSEIVAYIKANKSLIESITTDKISVSDIIDNLETNLTTKPLSAAQGVVLKSLIDTLNGVINELTPSAIGALSKNQGAANVGKVLVVGTDGNVIPMMLPTEDSDEDIIGVLDESNNIILMGDLADGTYTLKYENEDGTYTEIGNLVVGEIVYYTVTQNLTNCTNSNNTTHVVAGESYSATISANSGYELSSVVVSMGDSIIPVSGGNISIASVTGDIVITSIAEPTPYTNQIPLSIEADGTPFNGGLGYKTGYRLSSSSGGESANEGVEVTGYIAVKSGDVVRVKNITLSTSSSDGVVLYFDNNKTKLDSTYTATLFSTDEGNGVYASAPITRWAKLGYIRFTSSNIDDTSIVTVNEEIV